MALVDVVIVSHKGDWCKVARSLSPFDVWAAWIIRNDCEDPTYSESDDPRFVWPRENVGWVRGANAGLALSTAPYVVLANDDVEVCTPDWHQRMIDTLEMDPKIACVGPRTEGTSPQGRLQPGSPRRTVEPRLGLDKFGIGWFPISFFFVMFRREALEDVGLLGMYLADGHGGDDDDWQARAHLRGWKIAWCPDVLVQHEFSTSIGRGEEKANAQARNLAKMHKRWDPILRRIGSAPH